MGFFNLLELKEDDFLTLNTKERPKQIIFFKYEQKDSGKHWELIFEVHDH